MKNLIKSDEQSVTHQSYGAINWVGMSNVESCILDQGKVVPTELDMHVNLKPGLRGIHMSRLYALQMNELLEKKLDLESIQNLMTKMVESQEGTSDCARLKLKYKTLLKTKSLKSDTMGFRSYPIEMNFEMDSQKKLNAQVNFQVLYSSTCPQSAKLSKELFKEIIQNASALQKWYDSQDIYPATPHAQRSAMRVELKTTKLDTTYWIQSIEACLKTAVQTSVKKSDEMEFARLNAENTMFCEDAARAVADFLSSNQDVQGYRISSEHFESLHPHNAFSQISFNL